MQKINIKKFGIVISIFFSLGFIICFFWGLLLSPELSELHLNLLKMAYFGFSGLNLAGFILGLVQTVIWGWITALVFGLIWNKLN